MMNTYNLYATCLGADFAAGYMQSIQQACEACEQEPVSFQYSQNICHPC